MNIPNLNSNQNEIRIPSNVQHAIGVDGINTKVLPAGSTPQVVYRIGDGTVHPEGWDNYVGNRYLDFYVSTGVTGATGAKGATGASAYTQAVDSGYTGTQTEYWQMVDTVNQYINEVVLVGTNITTITNVNDNMSDINTVADNDKNITTVATNISDIQLAATNIADIQDVADEVAKVITVANDLNETTSEIETVAASITNVDIVGVNISSVNTVSGSIANINSVAGNETNINAAVANETNINAVVTNATNINTVSSSIADVKTVAGIDSYVSTVSGISGNVISVASNATNINTVAGISSDVTTVANNIVDIQNAEENADTATTKAAEALASANNAATSETNAASSASSAATSATNASASASSASTSASTAVAAKDAIQSYVIPTEATYNKDGIDLRVKADWKNGYTTDTLPEDRWLETNTPNVIVDKVSDPIVIDGVVYEQLGEELVTNGDFSDGTTGWEDLYSTSYVNTFGQGVLECTILGNGVWFEQKLKTIAGHTYVVKFNAIKSEGNLFYSRIKNQQGSPWTSFKNVTFTSSGTKEITFVAEQEDTWIVVGGGSASVGDITIVDNISVRELQQAELPDAPFATGTTDELLDDKVNGLTTQQAHSKGDIVVTGNELANIPDGTFTATLTGYTADTQLNTVQGQKYILKFTLANTGNNVAVFIGSTAGGVDVYNTSAWTLGDGEYTVEFTASTASWFKIGVANDSIDYSNISVKLKDSIYQATEDTTAGTLLSDTSKFQKLDFVTRQDLIYLTASGYKSMKGIHSFTDKELVEGGSDLIASTYGFSKLGDGLYEIDGEKATALQVSGARLNAGAYHPMFNTLGVCSIKRISDNGHIDWYEDFSIVKLISLFSCFTSDNEYQADVGLGAILNGRAWAGRPDSKFYDKIYIKGENGIAPHSTFYAKDSEFGSDRGLVGLMSGSVIIGNVGFQAIVSSASNSINNTFGYGISGNYWNDSGRGSNAQWNEGGKFYDTVLVFANPNGRIIVTRDMYSTVSNLSTGTTIFKDLTVDLTGSTGVAIYDKIIEHPQLLTYGESLTTDLIGDPANYPSEWKSYLAGGGVSSVNPLLVSDTGDNLIPDGTTKMWKGSKKHNGTIYHVYIQDVSTGYNWVTWTSPRDTVLNLLDTYAAGSNKIGLFNYTSYNTPYTQIDPTTITKVSPKVIASNSHSVYKGALITLEATGKVPVGNGSNGYESRVLENAEINNIQICIPKVKITLKANEKFYVGEEFTSPIYGSGVYSYSTDVSFTATTSSSFSGTSYFGQLAMGTTPQHPTISLDSSNSPAAKWFEVELEFADGGKGEGVITQELIYNETDLDYGDDTGDFGQLTNGTDTDLLGRTIQTKILGRRY